MSAQATLIIIICSIATVISVLVVLTVQLRCWLHICALRLAWEQEQLRDQQLWEVQQEKRVCELERHVTNQMQQLQETWHRWEFEDSALIAAHVQQYEMEIVRMSLEYEVLRLPRIEDVPLS